jgi:16S rRNA (uracil1498-N3)-methyltransferase
MSPVPVSIWRHGIDRMREIRVFVDQPLEPHSESMLPEAAAHHVARVLRMKTGEPLILFDGRGGQYTAVIARIDGRRVRVDVGAHHAVERESPLRITLAQGISRGKRMDYTLQKAVELGVNRIVPLLTEHSQVRLEAGDKISSRLDHWRGIVIAACEQSGRNRLPEIDNPLDLMDWLAGDSAGGTCLLLDPEAEQRLRDLPAPEEKISLLAGPEGGFSPGEREVALAAGCVAVGLGPRVLRTETAAPAAITACQSLWGDLG